MYENKIALHQARRILIPVWIIFHFPHMEFLLNFKVFCMVEFWRMLAKPSYATSKTYKSTFIQSFTTVVTVRKSSISCFMVSTVSNSDLKMTAFLRRFCNHLTKSKTILLWILISIGILICIYWCKIYFFVGICQTARSNGRKPRAARRIMQVLPDMDDKSEDGGK